MTTLEGESSLIRRTSVTELCNAWNESERQIREAFAILVKAQARLVHFFEHDYVRIDINDYNRPPNYEKPEEVLERLKRQVWGELTKKLELRKILSLARIKELDEQIATGKGLPPITVENVNAMLESNLNNMGQYLEEKVKEVYEWLRPCRTKYKTNEKSLDAGVGRKIILTWYAVQRTYKGGFEIHYNGQDKFRALDQVFRMLDGAAQPSDHYGELATAVQQQTSTEKNTFETPYFRGRCFQNGNMHLEFKRLDLLGKFNQVAGGMRLKDVKN